MMRKFVHKKLLLLGLFCTVAVCSFSQLASNKGKEFWVGFGHHIYMETDNSMTMVIYLSAEEQAADVTVTIDSSGNPLLPPGHPAGPWTRTYHLNPYSAISTEPIPETTPWDARLWENPPEQGGTGGARPMGKKGIHIVSTAPITAYAHIYGGAASGATMLMPVTTWGYEYVVLSSNQQYQQNTYSWMYIVATKDNTVIEVTPSVKTKYQDISGLAPGVTKTFTLMKGHIFQIRGANTDSDPNGNGGAASTGYQLSGTKVKSVIGALGECNPIAVFAGSSRTSNPIGSCSGGGGDNDNQQLFPMHAWGKRYLTSPFGRTTDPAGAQTGMIRIAFSQPPPITQLRINGVLQTLAPGSLYYTIENNTANLIEANHPIMVNQFMTGGACIGGGNGDPEMVVVAPVEQAIKQVVFYKNNMQAIQYNFVNIIVPTEGLPSLRIDNSAVFDYVYPHPRNALMGRNYTVVVKRWPAAAGQCLIKCDSAFNAITYGLGSVESYAYSAGAQVINLNALPGIHNQPDTSNSSKNIHQFTGVGTPMDLSVLMKYQPDRITWKFSEMTPAPGSCLSASPAITGDFVMNPASAYQDGTVIINNTTYYKYKLPQTLTFNCAGIYELPVEAYSPGITNCGSTEYFDLSIEVKQRPVVDFTYDHQTQCTKDSVYLMGPAAGLSGIEPMLISQWSWLLPGGGSQHGKDTVAVLPAGSQNIRLVGVTDQGLLTDTVTKPLTVYPPPVTQITATPPSVCLGQSITFSQTASYGNPAIPLTNYYWHLGESAGPVFNGMSTTQTHTYNVADDYTVRGAVKVSDLCVSDTIARVVSITPEARIDFTYPTDCLPASGLAQFNASAVDWGGFAIVSYNWNFGDPASPGNTSTDQNPTHTYSNFGTFPVTLSIVNSTGCAGDTTIDVSFNLKPSLDYPTLSPVCADASPVSVATASVTNSIAGTGVYSGPGITNPAGTFDPVVAGPGTHTITYTYTTTSCVETIDQTITVYAPVAAGAGNYGPVCINAPQVALVGSPAGGTFSGPGVTGTVFNPATAGAGTHAISYTYTDGNGCINTAPATSITVNALPVVNAGTYNAICINAAAVTLAGTPAGGTFSGPGVSGNTFNPATAGAGTHAIAYNYTDANGCSNTAPATSIVVNALPVVSAGTYNPVCIDAAAITLVGTPAGGTFSGPGVTGTVFTPATAGAGTHAITYSYTDANGCGNTAPATNIVVNALPVVSAGTYNPVCIDAAAITLVGSPAGGTFSGPGVTGTVFTPATAGAGTHAITYSYTDANGCGNTAPATNIVVNALPVVSAGTYNPVCIDAAAITLVGTPAGGTFSGPGVTGTVFTPATAGAGTHAITYSYTDANGCSNTAPATNIVVNALPVVSAGVYGTVCISTASVPLTGTPAGGVFSGPGVTGNTFSPAAAGLGTHTINYSYTDANGCGSAAPSATITVNTLPVVDAGAYNPVCIDGGVVTLVGTPVGGAFSGPGVTGNTFDPSTAGAGTHSISYAYSDGNGCSGSGQVNIVVNALPVVSAGTYNPVCIDAAAVTLAGSPAGGTFSGPGVTGTTFNPATAGAGTHAINYTYTDANGCSNTAPATNIVVNALPLVSAGMYNPVCIDAAAVTLAGSPAGGTFSGPGVTGTTFNPAAAGAGTHAINYNYTDANGCSNTAPATSIVVNALPVVSAGTYNPVCIDAAAIILAGSPAGGTFSGPGVTGTTFNPATAGAGTQGILYTYTDENGCNGSSQANIVVNALPVVNAGTYNPLCIDGAAITLAGTPAGGTFSGPGVAGNTFNPATAGVGTHAINYSYTDANGCSNTAPATNITVNALPVVNAGVYNALCLNAMPVTLAGTPAGGTFSGPGVTGNTFNPATAGAGTHTIHYSYTDPNGCSNTAVPTTITVTTLPVVDAGTYNAVCADAAAITLVGTPAGGTFSGPGVTGSTFNPAAAGAGTHSITYTYIDASGCSGSDPVNIIVNALPAVNAGTYNPLCIDGAPLTLAGTPAGGTFSGPGVSGNSFDPSVAGAGVHAINYSYTDGNGCSNTATPAAITVNTLPVLNAGMYNPVCLNAATVNLTGTPAGGTFSGPGVTGNIFNPAAAGPGTHVIHYSYTDGNGCSNTATPAAITVNTLPVVNAGTYNPLCIDAAVVNLVGTPAGGTFSGPGVTGNTFNPATAGAGTQAITYTFTDANNCTNTAGAGIVVNPLPAVNAGSYNAVCIDAAAVNLVGTPAGGTFSGPGVTGTSFNPAAAGANTHAIVYTYLDANGCTNTGNASIRVNPLPVLNITTVNPLCINTAAVTLTATPAGGTFSGPGITGTTFNPATVGTGTYNITYSGVDGCSNSIITAITVNPLPVVNAAVNIPVPVCVDEPGFALVGSPAGGTFSGAGVSGNTFDPAVARAGNHVVTYVYTNPATGCTNSATATYIVNPLPVIDAGQSFVVSQGSAVTFKSTAGAGGLTFSWDPPIGLNDPTSLNPTLLAIADQTYTLTATSAAGCVATDYITVKILKPVKVPNAFSPNGDNIHDTWVIPNLVDYPGSTVEVFNRYGQRVFYAPGDGTPWDGRLNGKDLPVGVYYYVIQLKNGFKPMTGWVTIIR